MSTAVPDLGRPVAQSRCFISCRTHLTHEPPVGLGRPGRLPRTAHRCAYSQIVGVGTVYGPTESHQVQVGLGPCGVSPLEQAPATCPAAGGRQPHLPDVTLGTWGRGIGILCRCSYPDTPSHMWVQVTEGDRPVWEEPLWPGCPGNHMGVVLGTGPGLALGVRTTNGPEEGPLCDQCQP